MKLGCFTTGSNDNGLTVHQFRFCKGQNEDFWSSVINCSCFIGPLNYHTINCKLRVVEKVKTELNMKICMLYTGGRDWRYRGEGIPCQGD